MRRSNSEPSESDTLFSIGKILEFYGGDYPAEDLGDRPYVCFFHGERHPSATVNTSEGWFNCFGNADCPRGNAIQVIMKHEGLTYAESVKRAEEISGEVHTPVHGTSRRAGRLSGRAGTSGTRSVKRPWRSS